MDEDKKNKVEAVEDVENVEDVEDVEDVENVEDVEDVEEVNYSALIDAELKNISKQISELKTAISDLTLSAGATVTEREENKLKDAVDDIIDDIVPNLDALDLMPDKTIRE